MSPAGIFGPDRRMAEYAESIWHTKPVRVEKEDKAECKKAVSGGRKTGRAKA